MSCCGTTLLLFAGGELSQDQKDAPGCRPASCDSARKAKSSLRLSILSCLQWYSSGFIILTAIRRCQGCGNVILHDVRGS